MIKVILACEKRELGKIGSSENQLGNLGMQET